MQIWKIDGAADSRRRRRGGRRNLHNLPLVALAMHVRRKVLLVAEVERPVPVRRALRGRAAG